MRPGRTGKRAEEPGCERDRGVVIGDYAWIGMGSVILKGVYACRGRRDYRRGQRGDQG